MQDIAVWPWLSGKTFKEISSMFPDAVVLGWMTESGGGGPQSRFDVDVVPPNDGRRTHSLLYCL